ncbi:hypothetical protein [Pseudarthrobacter sp. BIM B-2242]|uniref:hypothetical protein n=1 Tax=Pseudarthrobacter sp. BIM B-2242 TaxID=2772401 RepID=UPI00168B68B8|nr:hypothetical protein [Pseudarthrobacter sp. BIM B-2242]QOD05849.1 hypothetical protein IDT60_22935 [Pseudarthrobacter sp. BIM B-2242]
MLEFIGHLVSSLLSGGTDVDVKATPRQCVKHALRISRSRRPLTPEQHEFAAAWLRHALNHLKDLKLESKEMAIRIALLKVEHASVVLRMT